MTSTAASATPSFLLDVHRLRAFARRPLGSVALVGAGLGGSAVAAALGAHADLPHRELTGQAAPGGWWLLGTALLWAGAAAGLAVAGARAARVLLTVSTGSALLVASALPVEHLAADPALHAAAVCTRYLMAAVLLAIAVVAMARVVRRWLVEAFETASGALRPLLAVRRPAARTAAAAGGRQAPVARGAPGAPSATGEQGSGRATPSRVVVHGPFVQADSDPGSVEVELSVRRKADGGGSDHWSRGTVLPGMDPDDPHPGPDVDEHFGGRGIAVSGGGIRSATFALGALGALRDSGDLQAADVLTSVSGGGYLAGALRLALQPLPDTERQRFRPEDDPGSTVVDVDEVFADGSPEVDHLRRHGRYLADGLREWLVALLVVARGVLSTTALLLLVTVVAGRWLGGAAGLLLRDPLRHGPVWDAVTRVSALHGYMPGDGVAVWPPQRPVLLSLLFLGTLALVTWTVSVMFHSWSGPTWAQRTSSWAGGVALLAVAAAVLTVGLPAVMWAASALPDLLGGGIGSAQDVAVSGALASTVTALTVLAAAAQRRGPDGRTPVQAATAQAKRFKGFTARLAPLGFVHVWQALVVAAGVTLVALVLVVLLGQVALDALVAHPTDPVAFPSWVPAHGWLTGLQVWHVTLTALLTAALAVVVATLDQTSMGLHPFYRRRMASAFAVRRQVRDGVHRALPYDEQEVTSLAAYASRVEGFPKNVFCASAHLGGQDVAPPGRRAVSFTFDGRWVGSPQLGWYPADADLRHPRFGARLDLDLTVQSAMAVSGGAFASAMGRKSTPYNVLLALSNARLGTWLPNPRHVRRLRDDHWYDAPLPRRRSLAYLLREIFGRYDADDPLVYVTDGGHYENLGLVELLRRRCRTIFCIDAAGGDPAHCQTLAEAITLAREELGVTVDLDRPDRLLPGCAPTQDDRPAWLQPRVAATPVVSGRVTYPAVPGRFPEEQGVLVVAKAVLDPRAPWDVVGYAASHGTFPHDSTGDQWFEHDQFDAYHALGRHVGEAAVQEMRRLERDRALGHAAAG